MRVLVTGSTGFLGQHLMKSLKAHPRVSELFGVSRTAGFASAISIVDGHHIRMGESQVDVSDETAVKRLLWNCKPDVIFHLAGNPIIKTDAQDPCRLSRENILPTHYLLEHCPVGTRFVLASSAAVYGNPTEKKWWFREEHPVNPSSVYGACKVACESLVSVYQQLGKVSGLNLRYVANVGAWASHGVVKDLLRKLASDSPELELFGDAPGSVKPFAYAGDTASATVFAALDTGTTGPLNVCPQGVLSVEELAGLIMENCGVKKPLKWLGSAATWKGDNPLVMVLNDKLLELGWKPQYPTSAEAVAYGVKEMVAMGAMRKTPHMQLEDFNCLAKQS